MSCNFLTRLLPFRRRRQVPDAFVAPALPTTDNDLQAMTTPDSFLFQVGSLSSYTLTILGIRCQFSTPFTAAVKEQLGILPGYLDCYIDASDGHSTFNLNIDFSTAVEAAMALARRPTIDFGDGVHRQLHFSTSNDHDIVEPPRKRTKTQNGPATPLPTCVICSENMAADTIYSKPCFYCKKEWCLECVRNQFTAALDDQERFPAKCCGRILHFDIAKGIMSDDDYAKYQTRFEQFNTTKPLYCANALCSAFLPSRIATADAKGHVICHECTTATCNTCRTIVATDTNMAHRCTAADEMTALLKQFDYKRCPRCNTGVAKMFGCSHVRCQCGAHWCWDCQRPVQICWSKPCERAREDGEETDDYDEEPQEESSDDEATVREAEATTNTEAVVRAVPHSIPPAEVMASFDTAVVALTENMIRTENEARATEATTNTDDAALQAEQANVQRENFLPPSGTMAVADEAEAGRAQRERRAIVPIPRTMREVRPVVPIPRAFSFEHQPPAKPADAPINLDAEDFDDWEAGEFDFGDEPIDESWDTWGCMHNWQPVHTKIVFEEHRQWLPDCKPVEAGQQAIKQINCLRCYKLVELVEPAPKLLRRSKSNLTKESQERPDSACDVSVPAPKPEDEAAKKKKRKAKKAADVPALFNCVKCGVFYCVACKKAAAKELRASLNDQAR